MAICGDRHSSRHDLLDVASARRAHWRHPGYRRRIGTAERHAIVSLALQAAQGVRAMTISMYKASVPIFVQFLTSLSALLDKAAAYAEAKKVDPSVLLNTRLAPDMFPLIRQ